MCQCKGGHKYREGGYGKRRLQRDIGRSTHPCLWEAWTKSPHFYRRLYLAHGSIKIADFLLLWKCLNGQETCLYFRGNRAQALSFSPSQYPPCPSKAWGRQRVKPCGGADRLLWPSQISQIHSTPMKPRWSLEHGRASHQNVPVPLASTTKLEHPITQSITRNIYTSHRPKEHL